MPAPRSITLSAVAFALAACGGPDLPSDVTWESEHFAYKTRAAEGSVCADILGPLEEHFAVMEQALGFTWPAGEKITYYKFLDGGDLRANSECGSALACTNHTSVETPFSLDGHELVHAYLRPTGFPPWLLLEGAAVALACELPLHPRPALSWQEAYGRDRQRGELRGAGAWLSGHLLRTRPVPSFLDLYRRANQDGTAGDLAALFQDIYGESLDAVWAEVMALERPPVICPWECSRPPITPDGITPVSTASVCGLSPQHTLDLGDDSEVVVKLGGNSGFGLGGCGDGSEPPRTFWSVDGDGDDGFGVYVLAAGSYFFAGPTQGSTLTVAAQPRETWVTSTCSATQTPPPWSDLRGGLELALPAGIWRVPLFWSTPRPVIAVSRWPATAPDALVCPDCGSAASVCQAVTTDQPFIETLEGTRFLQLTSMPGVGGPEFSEFSVIAR